MALLLKKTISYEDREDATKTKVSTPTPKIGYTFAGYCTDTSEVCYFKENGKFDNSKMNWNNIENTKTINLKAKWEAKKITCNSGYYLPKNSETCVSCADSTDAAHNTKMNGKYCLGSVSEGFKYKQEDQGLTSCSSLGAQAGKNDGSYTKSDGNRDSENSCYLNLQAGQYVAEAKKGPVDCINGYYCPSRVEVHYGEFANPNYNGDDPKENAGLIKCPNGYKHSEPKTVTKCNCYSLGEEGNYTIDNTNTCKQEKKKEYYPDSGSGCSNPVEYISEKCNNGCVLSGNKCVQCSANHWCAGGCKSINNGECKGENDRDKYTFEQMSDYCSKKTGRSDIFDNKIENGNLIIGCKCPAGMFSEKNSKDITNCKYTEQTKFCFGNTGKCFTIKELTGNNKGAYKSNYKVVY